MIDAINATGYGLTFGLMTRIDDRVQHVTERVQAGNHYVNRNQIGAIVGSQPFGGEGLSGTGPKAGGPNYLTRFTARRAPVLASDWPGTMPTEVLSRAVEAANADAPSEQLAQVLPGPTGESNRLTRHARDAILCLGPGAEAAAEQAKTVLQLGGIAVQATGSVDPEALTHMKGISGVLFWGDDTTARACVQALSRRDGPIVPLVTGLPDTGHACHERHVCVDTTAAGGNAALLGGLS